MVKELVATRYELLDRIGRGGAADVFRARDTRLDRIVALKVLREDLAGDSEFLERFKREAKIAASLNHPNVVMVHDFGTFGSTAFIAMEYVDGVSLKEQIALSGRIDASRAADVGSQVLSALAAAHARGLVHRDVKPQNVLLTRDGTAKLTDFGIAQGGAATGLTQAGTTVGTALYMAPEQIQGDPVGPGADIYATGVLLYEMLTGHPPFTGKSQVEVALHHLNDEPPPIASQVDGVPPALEATVARALAKDPADRFVSADDMLRALGPAGLAGDPLGATSVFATTRQPRVGAGAPGPTALAAEAAALGEAPEPLLPRPATRAGEDWWGRLRTRPVAPLAAALVLGLGVLAAALGGLPELRLNQRSAALSASVDPSTAGTVLSSPTETAAATAPAASPAAPSPAASSPTVRSEGAPTTAPAPATAAPPPSARTAPNAGAPPAIGSGAAPGASIESSVAPSSEPAPPPSAAPARPTPTPAAPPPQPAPAQSAPAPQPAPPQSAPAPQPPPQPAPTQAPAPAPAPPSPTPASAPSQPKPTSAPPSPTASAPPTGAPSTPASSPASSPASPAATTAATSAPPPAPTAAKPAPTTAAATPAPASSRTGASGSPSPALTPVTTTP